jgi:DNA-binding NarL/FixJ family response regulator
VKKILVVDDDKTLRAFISRYLENHGYTVQDASSGIEALQLFEQAPPDLVVSDVIMPEMDGLEFCRRLRATRLGQLVPFIFLSGKGELEDRIQGHSMGADDYVPKPFEPRELVAKIEAQLERSRRIHCEIVRLMQQLSPLAPTGSPNEAETVNSNPAPAASSVSAVTPKALPLTPAEARVFWEVIQGLTNKQISDRLFISPRTVQSHLSNILTKLELENRSQLVRFAYERGYQPPAEA